MRRRKPKRKKSYIIVKAAIFLIVGGAFLFVSTLISRDGNIEYTAIEAIETSNPVLTDERQQLDEYVANDLTTTLDSILGRTDEQAHIIGSHLFGSEPLFNDDEMANKVNAAITYEIIDAYQVDYMTATATILVSAPDLSIILSDAVAYMVAGGNDDVDMLLATVERALSAEHEVFEDSVEVSLELIGDNWFLVPNAEFSNVLSGNLVQLYAQVVEEMIQEMTGGDYGG